MILTTQLGDGRIVLGKIYKGECTSAHGEVISIKYANRTQAKRKVMQLGEGWIVTGRYPFYVTKLT